MFKTTQTTTTYARCTTDNPFGWLPGAYYQINGTLPRVMARCFESVEDVPAGRHVLEIDAAAAAQDLESEKRRETPPPAPPRLIAAAQIRKRFGWSEEDFETARGLGFPRSVGMRVHDVPTPQAVSMYLPDEVDRWLERMRRIAPTVQMK